MNAVHIFRSWGTSRFVVVVLTTVLLGSLTAAWSAPSGSPIRQVEAAETLPIGSIVEVIDPQLYLRSDPGFSSTVLARMALGTRGTVLAGPVWSNSMPWYQIQTSAYGTGWASGTYLKLISAPQATSTPASGFAAGTTVEVIDPNLYLRSAPGFNSTVLARMVLGTRGTVLAGPTWANGHPWYQIRTSAYGTGWASGTYLRLAGAEPAPTQTPTTGMGVGSTVETTVSSLNLRASPSLTARVVAIMAAGTRGTIVAGPTWANNVPWYQIRTNAYGTGWASGYYLRVPGSNPITTQPSDGLSRVITKGVSGRAEVAITIDAGSDRGWAKQMLDVLKANGVKVTFGMTGAWAAANPDLVERMVDEGHQLINHTWSHPSFTGFSATPALTNATSRKSELTRTADFVYELTRYRMTPYWRPPYGDINTSVRKDAYDAGYWQTVMWSIDSMGWNGATVNQILNSCGYNAKAGDIILMHVGYSSKDYASLQQLIDILEGKGYSLVTIDQLLR